MTNQHITLHRLEVGTTFRVFDNLVRYKGTHLMAGEIELLHKLTFEAVVKSYLDTGLQDAQTNFETKLNELRWVNGYNDVQDSDFYEIYTEWMNIVLELIDEYLTLGIFDYDRENESIEINVGQLTDSYVNIEVIKRDR
jgi:hypothetical protein